MYIFDCINYFLKHFNLEKIEGQLVYSTSNYKKLQYTGKLLQHFLFSSVEFTDYGISYTDLDYTFYAIEMKVIFTFSMVLCSSYAYPFYLKLL